jgi:uncharacterized protein involved in type VI secretion and phage assembly
VSNIIGTIQAIVRQELQRLRITELGVVEAIYSHATSDDTDNYGCDVRLKNSGLLLKRVPVATGHIGTASVPNIHDLVLLSFDKGDINQPIITGRLYNDSDRPPLNKADEVIFRLPLAKADDKTVKAAIRNFQNDEASREIIIEMAPKITVRITDGTVRAVAGKTEMKLDQPNQSGGTVTILAGRTKIVMNQDGDITVEAAGSITMKATRDLTLQGQNISIKSQMKTEIQAGTQATLKAGAETTVDGGASTTVRGAMVTIKGVTSFSP